MYLFEFIKCCEEESVGIGWGWVYCRVIVNWYLNYGKKGKGEFLVFYMMKYKICFGWNYKDVFCFCYIKLDVDYFEIKYLVMVSIKGKEKIDKSDFVQQEKQKLEYENLDLKKVMVFMDVVEKVEKCREFDIMICLILEYKLMWEYVFIDLLKFKEIWKVLIKFMLMIVMIRNFGKMF